MTCRAIVPDPNLASYTTHLQHQTLKSPLSILFIPPTHSTKSTVPTRGPCEKNK